jgi:putative acetyltransferase
VPDGEICLEDPRATDVRELLERHLSFAHGQSPPEDVHALDIDGLLDPAVTFFSFRLDGELLAVGALKRLDERHAELKSMHTVGLARGRGIGRAMLDHLLREARDRGFRQVSLETGSTPGFAPARSLYESAGFTSCEPFGDYRPSSYSTFMTLSLGEPGFHLVAEVSSNGPAAIEPVLSQLIIDGTVTRTADGFHVDGWMQGADARMLNRELLSALRRVERRTRLRAEWTGGGEVHRFFDYVPKGTRPAPPDESRA